MKIPQPNSDSILDKNITSNSKDNAPTSIPIKTKKISKKTIDEIKSIKETESNEKKSKEIESNTETKKEDKSFDVTDIEKLKDRKSPTSPETDSSFQSVLKKIGNDIKKQKSHNSVKSKVVEAYDAAKGPPNEISGKASSDHVMKMSDQAQTPKTFEKSSFKEMLLEKIESITPNNQKEANEFKKNNMTASIKNDLKSEVEHGKEATQGSIPQTVRENPDTSNIEKKPVVKLPPIDAGIVSSPISGALSSPKPKADSEVSLADDSKRLDTQMAEDQITEEQLLKSNEPEFQDALASKHEAQVHSKEDPLTYRKNEQIILSEAQVQSSIFTGSMFQQIHTTRLNQFNKVNDTQIITQSDHEKKITEIYHNIENKYKETKTSVDTCLITLDNAVNKKFDSGAEQASREFEVYVDFNYSAYKSERYGRVGGWVLWKKDEFFGLPDEVNEFYTEGKKMYLQKMGELIDTIAGEVETSLKQAKEDIATGKNNIKTYLDSLPKEEKLIGKQAADKIQNKFDALEQGVDEKKDHLIDSLSQKYVKNLQNVDERINEMKEANKGLVSKAKDAIVGVIKTIRNLKNMLLGVLAKAINVIPKIIKDPIKFVGNLVKGVKTGLENFVANIGKHIQKGFSDWLFGTLTKAGIQMPETFDEKGILGLVLQVLGLTYTNIRVRAVTILGENIVSKLEQTSDVFKILVTEGPSGLWVLIKEKVGDLKTTVFDGIKSFVMHNVITAGIVWLVSLLNPASAFIKAAKAIYDIIMFFVEKGSQIMSLVNAVLDSVSAIAEGVISIASSAVENALGKAVPVAIGFLASLLGLGDISKEIQEIIKKVQSPISNAIDWVIHKAVHLVKETGKMVGIGKDTKEEKMSPEKQERWDKGNYEIATIQKESEGNPLDDESITKKLLVIKQKYQYTKLSHKRMDDDDWIISAGMSPAKKILIKAPHLLLSNITYGDKLSDAGFASNMKANPLTVNGVEGSKPMSGNGGNEIFGILNLRRKGNGSFYVKGHLLNQKLHGSGTTWGNLTPLSRTANSEHEREVEHNIKELVLNKPYHSVEYTVTPQYKRPSKTKFKFSGEMNSKAKDTKLKIVKAEEHVPTKLITTLRIIPNGKIKTIHVPVDIDQRDDPNAYEI